MRWQSTQCDATRTRSGFLWFPRMAFYQKWRWLERATWRETYNGHGWQIVEWLDDEPRYTLTEAGRKHLEGGK
jgi:hypothetical protein